MDSGLLITKYLYWFNYSFWQAEYLMNVVKVIVLCVLSWHFVREF
jgi:hypothetical protein